MTELKPAHLSFIAKAVSIGGGRYVRIPKRIADYLRIEKGTQVVLKIIDVEREEEPQ